jgi:thioredoxin reductase
MAKRQIPVSFQAALSAAQQATFEKILTLIIPPSDDGRLPGAASYDVWGHIEAHAGAATAKIRTELDAVEALAAERVGVAFAELDEADAHAVVEELRRADRKFMAHLARQTAACYYQQDEVLVAIGMEPRPPFPKGYDVHMGDLSLLDPVRERGRKYREV